MTATTPRGAPFVVCDFDETAAECNVARLLLREFAGPAVQQHRAAHSAGRITFREYQERAFDTVTASVDEMQAYVLEHAGLRPGLHQAVDATRAAGGTFTIASAGLDIYIQPLLNASGLGDVPVKAVTAIPKGAGSTPPFRYDYPAGRDYCRGWAVCKCLPLEEGRASGRHTVFVGDGPRSDECAAAQADTVFARGRLLDYCRRAGIAAHSFNDFFAIARYVSRLRPGAARTSEV